MAVVVVVVSYKTEILACGIQNRKIFAGGIRNAGYGGSTGKESAIHNVESTYITTIFEDSHSTL